MYDTLILCVYTCSIYIYTHTHTHTHILIVDLDCSVGIATRYGLDGPGIEIFLHLSRPALGPTQPPIEWVPGLSRGYSGWGVALIATLFSAEVKERVEPYLFSPSGPSWPFLGWNLSFLYLYICVYGTWCRESVVVVHTGPPSSPPFLVNRCWSSCGVKR